ncbi:hypothetical protein [Streptomyces sp. NPDC048659]|uniref:hypothetical protein n=1 Tax=Streptomyces sp. NPDC048659 TaxID=3155489 RepID=UPI00341BC4FC
MDAGGREHGHAVSELMESRDLARRWQETGTEAELRRRTGSQDDLVSTRVQDDRYYTVDRLTLGGMTVWDGHGAILTRLERLLGIRTPCEELITRAMDRHQGHAAWGEAAITLAGRREQESWTAAETLHADPDPARRVFGAELMCQFEIFGEDVEEEFYVRAVTALVDWSEVETDSAVLAVVPEGLYSFVAPRAEAALLAHAGHHHAGVRRSVAAGIRRHPDGPHLSDGAREALLTLLADPDAEVRRSACFSAAAAGSGDPALTEVVAVLLDDPERPVQLAALYGLAMHDDDRCVAAADRWGGPRRGFGEQERGAFESVWWFQRQREDRGRA